MNLHNIPRKHGMPASWLAQLRWQPRVRQERMEAAWFNRELRRLNPDLPCPEPASVVSIKKFLDRRTAPALVSAR